eukprot:7627147-Pyramimonas_sp.AAC.1
MWCKLCDASYAVHNIGKASWLVPPSFKGDDDIGGDDDTDALEPVFGALLGAYWALLGSFLGDF